MNVFFTSVNIQGTMRIICIPLICIGISLGKYITIFIGAQNSVSNTVHMTWKVCIEYASKNVLAISSESICYGLVKHHEDLLTEIIFLNSHNLEK